MSLWGSRSIYIFNDGDGNGDAADYFDDDDDTQQSELLTLGGEDYSSDYLDYLLAY